MNFCGQQARAATSALLFATSMASAHSASATPVDSELTHPTSVAVGAGAVVRQWGSANSRVDYGPSLGWRVHATVVLLPWLGLHTAGGMDYLQGEVRDGALRQPGVAEEDPSIAGPRISVELQPSHVLAPRLTLFGRLGAAWFRPAVEAFELDDPSHLIVSRRSGVVVEFPLGVGARYDLLEGRLGLTADASFSLAGSQSGDLFDSGAGTSQSVRQDTGELARVGPFPKFTSALGAGLSLELSF